MAYTEYPHNQSPSSINFAFDGDGTALTTGTKIDGIEIPFDCLVDSVTLAADQSGSIELDILKGDYGDFPAMVSLVGSTPPRLVSEQKSQDDDLSDWAVRLNAGDLLQIEIISVTNVTRLSVSLKLTRI